MDIEKLIEMIRKNIGSIVIQKNSDEDSLTLAYDTEAKQYSAELKRVLKDGETDIKTKKGLSIEQIIPIITDSEFKDEILAFYQQRIAREANYAQAKQKLIEELTGLDISSKEKETMLAIIEQVAQLPEYAGAKSRVVITSSQDFEEHLRLADATNWDDKGADLHLQLVQAIREESGTVQHNYPQKNLSEIVEYISDKDINIDIAEEYQK